MAEPYCLAMVLCDHVHRDRSTGKVTILGTFSVLRAAKFPAQVTMSVYAAITDGFGPTTISVRIVDSRCYIDGEDAEPIFGIELPQIDIESPLMVMESAIEIKTKVDAPGQYHCELFANGALLMSRRLLVVDTASPSP
jgi:hypothetical protein